VKDLLKRERLKYSVIYHLLPLTICVVDQEVGGVASAGEGHAEEGEVDRGATPTAQH
jgi:hypothetical protein